MAASASVSLLVRGLRHHGLRAALLIIESDDPNASAGRRAGHSEGVPYVHLGVPATGRSNAWLHRIRAVFNLRAALRRRTRCGQTPAIIFGDRNLITFFLAWLICRRYRAPLIAWAVERNSLYQSWSHSVKGRIRKFSLQFFERVLVPLADGCYVYTTRLRDFYARRMAGERILLSPIQVDPEEVRQMEACRAEASELFPDRVVLIYSGSLDEEKDGMGELLRAVALLVRRIPNVLLVMTGKSLLNESGRAREVRAIIEQLGLGEHVHMTGYLSRADLVRLYARGDVFLVCRPDNPFANHGFPWKMGEFSMAARPIVATPVSDIGLYFKDGESVYMARSSGARDIAEAMERAVRGDSSTVGRMARDIAVQNFDYRIQGGRIAAFIARLSETHT